MATAEEIDERMKARLNARIPTKRKKPVPAKKQVAMAKRELLQQLRDAISTNQLSKCGHNAELRRGYLLALTAFDQKADELGV